MGNLLRLRLWIRSPRPWLMIGGFALVLSFWYVSVEVLRLPRFRELPGPSAVFSEWFSPHPAFGLSIYTPIYYWHILASLRRVALSFALATVLGVPLGLAMGWSERVRHYVFPIFEIVRPIPPLAWVPLAILMFKGTETPIIFLTFLSAFFATTLNAMLGVASIDPVYFRAARCLGASPRQVLWHVVLPGSLRSIFDGLQIAIGVSWFSLVAAEMISGEYGLGYIINTGYTMATYPTIVIGMITLGCVGFVTSAAVRLLGRRLISWRVDQLEGAS